MAEPTPVQHQVVRASAGAGKTYQLTTRYLRLLERGDPTADVLATTFTRKAAGEVLARVLGRLAEACRGGAALDALRGELGQSLSQRRCTALLRTLTDALHRLSVGTIDGFFNRAAQAMAFELGLPADPRMIDEGSPLARQMRADAIHAALAELVDERGGLIPLIEMLRRLHHDTAQRSVTDAIDQIVVQLDEVYRLYPDRSLWDALPTAGLLEPGLLTTVLHGLEALAGSLPTTKQGKPNKLFSRAYQAILADSYAERWDAVLANGLVTKIEGNEPVFARAAIPEDFAKAIHPLFVHAKAVRLNALAEQTRATYELLALFHRHYAEQRSAQGVLLFSDLTHLLADGLKGDEIDGLDELCFRLDARVTHLLLDEFQDTSLRQWEVLQRFADEIVATGDGSRSLFVVGDTKQAIYGWRGGCAELFDAVEAMPGIGEAGRIDLSESWRSSQTVLDSVNTVFGSLADNEALSDCADAAAAWQDGFKPHRARRALPGHVLLATTAPDDAAPEAFGEDLDIAPADAHAYFTARHIQRMSAEMPGRSIGVLVRRRDAAQRLMHELRALGVPAAEEGGNPIDNAPAVSAVLSAVQFADHPGDRVARFHAMNSPVGEVLGLHADNADAVARSIRCALIDAGYAALIARWTRALAPSCDARALDRLQQLIAVAERFDEHEAGLRPSRFVDAARATRVDDPASAAVRVMTVHASKGLEFDAVVLPDLDALWSRSDSRDLVVLDRDSPIDPVRAVYRRAKQDTMALLPQLEQALKQRTREKRTEDLCLLYVAMTRARHALHMLVRPLKQSPKSGKRSTAGLTNLSYAAVLRQSLSAHDHEGFAGGETLYTAGDPAWCHRDAPPARPPATPAQPAQPITLAKPEPGRGRSWTPTTPSAMHAGGAVAAHDLLRLSKTTGRAFGVALHALFERVGFLDDGEPGDDDLDPLLVKHCTPGIDRQQLRTAFHAALKQPGTRALLHRHNASALWRERPFAVRVEQRLVRGVFDRVHLFGDPAQPNAALLIDFKTDRVDDDTLGPAVERYADQLRLYRAALAVLLGIDTGAVEAKLLFVSDGKAVTVGSA